MAKFDSILGTIGRTPVVKNNKLAPAGVNLYVKIEAFNPLGRFRRLDDGKRQAILHRTKISDSTPNHRLPPKPA